MPPKLKKWLGYALVACHLLPADSAGHGGHSGSEHLRRAGRSRQLALHVRPTPSCCEGREPRMKLVTPGDSAPASVNRYLLPHEQQVITMPPTPCCPCGAAAIVLGSLIAAV